MTLEFDMDDVLQQLEMYTNDQIAVDEKEATINAQIASLRLELAKLKDTRYTIKRNIQQATQKKASIERQIELKREAEIIEQTIAEKRAEAAEIIANAPWKDVAFKWQIDGAIQLPERALLGDKRGLGKTLSAIIWRRVQKSKKTLVCLRKEVASDFIKELGIREPDLFVYPLLGANPETRKIAAMLLNHQKEFVVVTNIESWRRDVDTTTDDILKIEYDALILDEAHHIKNSATGTAQGFFRLAQRIPKVLELTGTPIKNRPQEMFSLLHALYPELFPKELYFLRDYCTQLTQNKWVFSPTGLVNLVRKISSFYIARSPEDIGRQIPPPKMIEYKLTFDQHPQQREAYKAIAERSIAVLSSEVAIPIVSQLAVMTRLAQTVSWPSPIHFKDPETEEVFTLDVPQSAKMDWAEDLLRELVEEGERVIVFSRFKPAIYELKRRLWDLSVAVITGDEKAKGNTEEVFNDFDLKTAPEKPKYQILLATYQTVGESANLNAARHMILYDRFWNPGNEDQAVGRIDRINSIDQATVHIPLVETSIDEYMTALIEGKRNIVSEFKDASTMQHSLRNYLKDTI